jgi:hypothetical protein
MPIDKQKAKRKVDRRRKHEHWLVTIRYHDNEVFARVYLDQGKAERFAARQKKSPVVKSTQVKQLV